MWPQAKKIPLWEVPCISWWKTPPLAFRLAESSGTHPCCSFSDSRWESHGKPPLACFRKWNSQRGNWLPLLHFQSDLIYVPARAQGRVVCVHRWGWMPLDRDRGQQGNQAGDTSAHGERGIKSWGPPAVQIKCRSMRLWRKLTGSHYEASFSEITSLLN